ncbi:FadR/GntR family transcriptional regulator [Bauldia sp.]|uniref:FadR/GntR family transcriptional regulator n=1 Tax=Bauldia sp. TaxID=2575872 RepID=UPI003BAAF830
MSSEAAWNPPNPDVTGTAIGAPKPPSLVGQTVDRLGEAIVGGTYQPGTVLPPEAELARVFGVSRNVVREAVKVLAANGLVRVSRGSGTTVEPAADWNYFDQSVIGWMLAHEDQRDQLVDELSTLRFIIEPEVAALAAEFATTTEILRLFEAFEAMERHLHEPQKAVEADILFHRRLFEAAHNRLLMGMLRTVVAVLRANFALAIKADYAIIEFLEEHRVVAEAINRREPDAARAAMQVLLSNNKKNLTAMRREVAKQPPVKPGAAKP